MTDRTIDLAIPQPGDRVTFKAGNAIRFGEFLWLRGADLVVCEDGGSFHPGAIHRVRMRRIMAVNGVSLEAPQ